MTWELAIGILVGSLAVWGAVRLGRWLERDAAIVVHETRDTWSALQRNAVSGERVPTPPPVLRPGVGLTPKKKPIALTNEAKA